MSPTVDDLLIQAERLPIADRERLVERILQTMVNADPAIESAWKLEVERRLDAIDRGDDDAVAWEVVRKELGLG